MFFRFCRALKRISPFVDGHSQLSFPDRLDIGITERLNVGWERYWRSTNGPDFPPHGELFFG
jgi:hypothetical protein